MNRYMALIFLLSLMACETYHGKKKDKSREELKKAVSANADTTLDKKDKFIFENIRMDFEHPIAFDSISEMLIPIRLNQKYVDKGEVYHSYFNFAIVDSNLKVTGYLFDRPVVIESYRVYNNKKVRRTELYYSYDDEFTKALKAHKTLYNKVFITASDYDADVIGSKQLYTYDVQTKSLQQISDPNSDLSSWYYLENSPIIIMNCLVDSDNNHDFSSKLDDYNVYMIDLSAPDSIRTTKQLFDLKELKRLKYEILKHN